LKVLHNTDTRYLHEGVWNNLSGRCDRKRSNRDCLN